MGDEYIPAGKECAGRSDCVPAPQVSGAGSVAFALALVAHAHADIHQEVEETFPFSSTSRQNGEWYSATAPCTNAQAAQ